MWPARIAVITASSPLKKCFAGESFNGLLEQVPSVCRGLRPLRPAGFIPARPYQSECAAGGRYGALETALGRHGLTGPLHQDLGDLGPGELVRWGLPIREHLPDFRP